MQAEAVSLAGHLKLGKLIALYDDNHISIDGDTALGFTEDGKLLFKNFVFWVVFSEVLRTPCWAGGLQCAGVWSQA